VPAIGIRLSSALCFPAPPSRRPSACAAGRPSSPAFQLNLRPSSAVAFSCPAFPSTCDLRRLPTLQPCPRTQPPTLIGCCISGSAFRSASDMRRLLALPPCLRTQPPAFTGCCILRLRLLADLRLAPPIYPPARLRNSTSDELRRHQLRRTLGLANLCTQVQIDRLLWISSSSPQAERPIPQRSRRRVTVWLGWRIYFGSLKGREPSASILKMRKSWRKLHFYRRPCERTLRSPATAKDKVNTLSFFSNPIASLILSIAGLSA
jgi:hypothetical protein